ncbi:unnamed protein product [Closterium sp. NIES-65]|nr:unnamed protein product [Closterium sp. NIES-65]
MVPCGQIPVPMAPKGASYIASVSLLVQLVMLAIALLVGHGLRRKKIVIIPEAGAALAFGVLVGLVVKFLRHGSEFREWINFNNNFFFYFLLPPIILYPFTSSVSLLLFKSPPLRLGFLLSSPCLVDYARMSFLVRTYAPSLESLIASCVPTLFAIVFARNSFFLNRFDHFDISTESGWSLKTKPFFNNFGAILSVLAVFQELGVDRTLYAQVFGESVLNDAVDGRGVWFAISFFLANFIGSFSIGVIMGLLSALVFKHCGFEDDGLALLQACLLSLFPYMAYMLADAFELSGIVAILFAGMTMRYYTAPHLNEKALATTSSFFSILAKLSETFKQSRIPMNHQHALWFSGLRGAMAFALALQSITDLPDEYGRDMQTEEIMVAQPPEKPQSNLKKKFQQLKEKASFASIDKNFLTPVFATPSRSHPRLVELDPNVTPPQAHRPSSSSVDGTERRAVEIELAPVDELFPVDDDSMTIPLTTALSLPLEGGHLSRRASANSQQGG